MLFCSNQITEINVIIDSEKTLNVTSSMYMPTTISNLLAQSPRKKITPFKIMYDACNRTTPVENQPKAT